MFKKKLNKIKSSTLDPLREGCRASDLDASGLKPALQARLLLATAIAYGAGVLPVGMFTAKKMADVRQAIAVEAKAFLQRNDLSRLKSEMKEPAKKMLDFWIEAVAKEAELAAAATAATPTHDSR